jgi:hypothetical protein
VDENKLAGSIIKLAEYQLGEIPMTNEIDKLGPKDFITGCLVIVVAVFVVPILILLFKVSVYLAIVIAVIVAVILGVALLGKVVRLIFFRSRSDGKDRDKYIE